MLLPLNRVVGRIDAATSLGDAFPLAVPLARFGLPEHAEPRCEQPAFVGAVGVLAQVIQIQFAAAVPGQLVVFPEKAGEDGVLLFLVPSVIVVPQLIFLIGESYHGLRPEGLHLPGARSVAKPQQQTGKGVGGVVERIAGDEPAATQVDGLPSANGVRNRVPSPGGCGSTRLRKAAENRPSPPWWC